MRTNLIKPIIFLFAVFIVISCNKTHYIISPKAKISTQNKAKIAAFTVYNEGLATVYRGIQIPNFTATTLGIGRGGYYHIREFRVAGQVSKKAIVLSILKHYGENINPGQSILPQSNEPWVFHNFVVDNWSANIREVEVKDNFNHTLKIKITLNESKNCCVTSATLNNLPVTVSTQTYTTSIHNSCSFMEPSWTVF
jgi:hypothetical protein